MAFQPESLSAALRHCARVAGDALAFLSLDGPPLTYRQWDRGADAVGEALRDLASAGDTVVARITDGSDIAAAIALLGALRAGCFLLPMSGRFVEDEVVRITALHSARVILSDGDASLPIASRAGVAHLAIDRGQEGKAGAEPSGAGGAVFYTAGTTAPAAAVRWTQADLLTWLTGWTGMPQERPHMHAFRWDSSDAAGRIARTLLRYPGLRAPEGEPDAVPAIINQYRPVDMLFTAADARILARGPLEKLNEEPADKARGVYVSWDASTRETIDGLRRAFSRAIVTDVYCVMEAGRGQTWMRYPPARSEDPVPAPLRGFLPVGTGLHGTTVRITDDAGAELPARTVGQIWIRPGMPSALSYCPQAARAGVFMDDWVRTGDLGLLDEDGCLFFAGRAPRP